MPSREEREVCFRFLSREGEVYETAPPTFRMQPNERPCRFFIVSILIALKNIPSPFPLRVNCLIFVPCQDEIRISKISSRSIFQWKFVIFSNVNYYRIPIFLYFILFYFIAFQIYNFIIQIHNSIISFDEMILILIAQYIIFKSYY